VFLAAIPDKFFADFPPDPKSYCLVSYFAKAILHLSGEKS
jgi:hypothetical protein